MSEDSIFNEVNEELRSDRVRALWRRFAPFAIGGAVAVVLLVAGNEGWQWWQSSSAARSSDELYVALDLAQNGDYSAAREQLDTVITEGTGGYPLLARFKQAAILAAEGETGAAVAAYDTLAGANTPQRLREIALLLAGQLLVDSGDVAAVEARVGGLVSAGNPLANLARETIGLVQYKAGDIADARASFEVIVADPLATQEMVGRVRVYIDQLVAEGAAGDTSGAEPAADTPAE